MTEYEDLHQLAANTVRILADKFGSLDALNRHWTTTVR